MPAFNPSFSERLRLEVSEARRCTCPTWPCTYTTCIRCPACTWAGGALITAAEERWLETGEGLSRQEQAALRKLSGSHGSSGLRAKQRTKGAA